MTVHLDAGDSGALFVISGTVSNSATWDELYHFYQDGAGYDISGLSFQLQIRNDFLDTSASVTLSTAASQLVITNDDGGNPTILRINVPYSTISGLQGDYIVDLVAKDADDKLTHFGHGVVTFRQSPIAF